MEIWKDIDGYQGYQVSTFGRVRTHNKISHSDYHGDRKWKDRILKQKLNTTSKYMQVNLWRDKNYKTFYVHRLVALTFLEKPTSSNMTVNHIDGNTMNNNVQNLEWLSLADNIRHGYRTGLYSKKTKEITLIDDSGNEFYFSSYANANRFLSRTYTYLITTEKRNGIIKSAEGKIYTIKKL